jgi:outer membrane lipoprotein LolB
MRAFLQTAAAASVLLVSACVAPVPRSEGPEQAVDLATLSQWRATGRMAVAADGSGGSGSLDWEQQGNQTRIRIQGPIGIGGMNLVLEGDAVQLEASDGRRLESQAAWTELEARLGAPVPARNLRYWMLGIPAPGPSQWRSEASPKTLEQDGWVIVYERSILQSGAQLPTRLTATSGASRVRLVIDRWVLGSGAP